MQDARTTRNIQSIRKARLADLLAARRADKAKRIALRKMSKYVYMRCMCLCGDFRAQVGACVGGGGSLGMEVKSCDIVHFRTTSILMSRDSFSVWFDVRAIHKVSFVSAPF